MSDALAKPAGAAWVMPDISGAVVGLRDGKRRPSDIEAGAREAWESGFESGRREGMAVAERGRCPSPAGELDVQLHRHASYNCLTPWHDRWRISTKLRRLKLGATLHGGVGAQLGAARAAHRPVAGDRHHPRLRRRPAIRGPARRGSICIRRMQPRCASGWRSRRPSAHGPSSRIRSRVAVGAASSPRLRRSMPASRAAWRRPSPRCSVTSAPPSAAESMHPPAAGDAA